MTTKEVKANILANEVVWDLSEFYTSINDEKITKTLDDCLKKSEAFESKYASKVAKLNHNELKLVFEELESILTPLYQTAEYISLEYSIKTNDDEIKQLVSKSNEIESLIENHLLFFDIELGKIDQDTINDYCEDPILKNYKHHINITKKTAKHNLSEAEEKIINLKNLTGSQAHRKLYNELTNSFRFKFEVDGNEKIMNGSELRSLRTHKDPKTRENAMKLFFSRYEDNQLVITHLFNNILKNYEIEKRIRNYDNAIDIKLNQYDLNKKSIEILHNVTTDSNHLVERYYKLKSKIVGIPKLKLSDIYAPLPDHDSSYSWEDTKTIVLESFKEFDNEFFEITNDLFNSNRIHAPVIPFKRGGAFCCSYTPQRKPFIMLNFLGKQRDVSTLAHELGHAIHDVLASKQTLMNYHPILPLAETASTFCEMLVTDKLLKQSKTKQEKIVILSEKLEDIFATSHRQNLFSTFEQAIHQKISDNIITTSEFCDIYSQKLQQMFGSSVEFSDEYQWEWAGIPHIFEHPFYVFSYNFGNLLVMSIYQQYLKKGNEIVPNIKSFLSLGSSKSPQEIANEIDVNFEDASFWESGIETIRQLLDQLEELVNS